MSSSRSAFKPPEQAISPVNQIHQLLQIQIQQRQQLAVLHDIQLQQQMHGLPMTPVLIHPSGYTFFAPMTNAAGPGLSLNRPLPHMVSMSPVPLYGRTMMPGPEYPNTKPSKPERASFTKLEGGHKPIDKTRVTRRRKVVLEFQNRLQNFIGPDLVEEIRSFTEQHKMLWTSSPPSLRFRVYHLEPLFKKEDYVSLQSIGDEEKQSEHNVSSATEKKENYKRRRIKSGESNKVCVKSWHYQEHPGFPAVVHHLKFSAHPSQNAVCKRIFARFSVMETLAVDNFSPMVFDLELRNTSDRQLKKPRDRDVVILKRVISAKMVFHNKERSVRVVASYAKHNQSSTDLLLQYEVSANCRNGVILFYLMPVAGSILSLRVSALKQDNQAHGSNESVLFDAIQSIQQLNPQAFKLCTLKVDNNKLIPSDEVMVHEEPSDAAKTLSQVGSL